MIDAETFEQIDKQLREAIDLIIHSAPGPNAMHAIRVINQARADLAHLKHLVLLPHSDESEGEEKRP